MLQIRLSLMAVAIAASTAIATPAQALFGFTCIPTLYNCMCTFRVPCPVKDSTATAKSTVKNIINQEKTKLLQEIKEPAVKMLQAMDGSSPFGIPGINSIGIDINGIMNGNLASLGIPALGGDLISQLNNLGIDGNLLSAIAGGKLGIDDFMSVAQKAGLDLSMLDDLGLGIEKITALANGSLDLNGTLDLAKSLGLEAGVLDKIGITQDLLVSISQGNIDTGRILEIAQHAGLDMSALESVGLDAATIANLPNAGPDFVASVLQKSGFDSSITTALGFDAGMITQIATGQLPPDAINQLVAGTGIDPSAIILPGVNGPIRVTDAIGSNVPILDQIGIDIPAINPAGSGMGGAEITTPASTSTEAETPSARISNLYDVITIPAESVPGLSTAIAGAGGTPVPSGTFNGADANIAAMCAADKALISVGEPPNGFGDDVENVHMAISGGNLDVFPEAVDEAQGAANDTSAFAYGRTMQIRDLLVKATEAVDTFDTMIEESLSLEDDVIINDTIRAQLMTAKAEKASVLTSLGSTRAAKMMQRQYLSPVPIFPRTARFRQAVMESSQTAAQQIAAQSSQQASAYTTNMDDYRKLYEDAGEAIHGHNLQSDADVIRNHIPNLEFTIDNHEKYKTGLFSLEQIIRNALLTLYGPDDADQAWAILHPQLISSAAQHTWPDPAKWQAGYNSATAFSQALTEQTGVTAYGTRVLISPATMETPSNLLFDFGYALFLPDSRQSCGGHE